MEWREQARWRSKGLKRSLEDAALGFALRDGRFERGDDSLVEHILQLRTSQRTSAIAPPYCSSPTAGQTAQQYRESEDMDSQQGRKGLTPFCVSAEHSTYLTAPSSRARRSPASGGTGRCFCRASFSSTAGSSRKSTWVPTIKQGTPGQWWCTWWVVGEEELEMANRLGRMMTTRTGRDGEDMGGVGEEGIEVGSGSVWAHD